MKYYRNSIDNFDSVDDKLSEYVFLHISKNGGTSIRNTFKHKNINFDLSHDYTANDIPKGLIGIAVIRDPVDRFISAFNFARKEGFKNSTSGNHPINEYKDINDFIRDIANKRPKAIDILNTSESKKSLRDASVIYWPQIHWLYSTINKKLILVDFNKLNKIFKEQLKINLPMSNKNYDKQFTEVSEISKKHLEDLYGPDFLLYSMVKDVAILDIDTNTLKQLDLGLPDKILLPRSSPIL